MVLMFTWDVYGDRICQKVTLRREENGYKRMCLGRLCIYILYWCVDIYQVAKHEAKQKHTINTKVTKSLSVRPSSSSVHDDTECVLSLLDVCDEGVCDCGVRLPTIAELDGTHKAHLPTAVPILYVMSVYKPSEFYTFSDCPGSCCCSSLVVYILFTHSCVVYKQYM